MKKLFFFVFVVFGLLFAGCDVDPDATYTVWYHDNGAEGFPPNDNKKYKSGDEAIVLDKNTLVGKDGKTFQHWNTRSDGSGGSYRVGSILTINNINVNLYAIWD